EETRKLSGALQKVLEFEKALIGERKARAEETRKLSGALQKVIELEKTLIGERKARTEEIRKLSDALQISHSQIAALDNVIKVDIKRTRQKQMSLSDDLTQLTDELTRSEEQLDRVKNNYWNIRDSFSFKLGNYLVNAITKPGKNTLMLPLNVYRNLKSRLSRSKSS
ncbi:MAG: hypothetical protein DRR42_17820, partial [Gammaproteobacteria bacterium]